MIIPFYAFQENQKHTCRSDHKSYHNAQTGACIIDRVHMLFHTLW